MSAKSLRTLVLVLALSGAAAGCVPAAAVPGTLTPTAVAVAPATGVPTALPPAPATPAPTAVPTVKPASPVPATAVPTVPAAATATQAPAASPAASANASYQGINFSYPKTLAQVAKGEMLPAEGGVDGPWWAMSPQHVEFGLTGYPAPKLAQAPRIAVYPATAFAAQSPEAAKRITALRGLLQTKPANTGAELPFLPFFDSAQMMHAGMRYLAFQNGQGVRYLTQYAQGLVPINNSALFYTFQGLTSDGTYYVSAILPVTHGSLPVDGSRLPQEVSANASPEEVGPMYRKYLNNATSALAAQPETSFEPKLADLDALVQSILVAPAGTEAVR